MGVGVEAAQVGLTELHQDLVRLHAVAGVFEIVGLGDGICERIVGIVAGQHPLHLELWARAAGDDRLGPLPDRLAFLAPVVPGSPTRNTMGASCAARAWPFVLFVVPGGLAASGMAVISLRCAKRRSGD
jgi:hypothetical protein